MSHVEDDFDLSTKYFNQKTSNDQCKKLVSLIDFVENPSRTEPLVGLQFVVEIKNPGSDNSIIKCNICRVKGHVKTMREHLTGLQHIKAYMEMYYFSELQSIRRSDKKSKVVTLIKDFAREIERAEGTQSVKIEYISTGDMKKEPDNWMKEKNGNYKFSNLQVQSPFLDRRQMALQYSENFKISSRAEASVVLTLMQQLSDNLEQYFLTCKGLEILPSVACGNKDSYINLGLESTLEKTVLKLEEPSSSSCISKNVLSIDSPYKMLKVDSDDKQNEVIHSQHDDDLQSSSNPGNQSRKRRKIEDPDQIPFISSSSIPLKFDDPYHHTPVKVALLSPSSSPLPYIKYKESLTEPMPYVSNTCDYGQFSMDQNSEHSASISQTDSNSTTDVKTNSESKPSLSSVTEEKGQTNLGMLNECDLDVTSSHTSSHEILSCGQTQGKTSKTLSPDILQLLKGKDANTVTNILKTLSPFYPALQDVNLEILAQVLVNTGALD